MTRSESELLAAIFLLYAYECIHWISSSDIAYTRSTLDRWTAHTSGPVSFTLLGWKPLLVDPLLLLPGFVRSKTSILQSAEQTESALSRVSVDLQTLWLLETQCRVQAILMLLFLPWILWMHRLLVLWPGFTLALAFSQSLIMVSVFRALRQIPETRGQMLAMLMLNPLGAIRALDAIAQILFEREATRNSAQPNENVN